MPRKHWTYYNDNDPYVCKWLENLIDAGHLPQGAVDPRPIQQVEPDDLRGFTHCHFFAGIGGWAYALQLADWPAEAPVWTGSCPCQPFSAAGKRKGTKDKRHLWPDFFRLIKECGPPVVFGEQVARAIAFGWLDGIFDDLESIDYTCAAALMPACSVGVPHKRDRLWFVANSNSGDEYRRDSSLQVGRSRGTQALAEIVSWGPEWAIRSQLPTPAYGVSARMEQCAAYGNAIVPQVAAAFISSFMEAGT